MIKGNTLYIKHESGNLGHYFNDHVYSTFAYYLVDIKNINNIFIELTDINLNNKDTFIENFNSKKLLEGTTKSELNFNMLIVFLYDCNKIIYIDHKNNINNYNFEKLIKTESDRELEKYTNYIEVFNKIHVNYELYIKTNNINNDKNDVSILYRTINKFERNIYNIELFENILKSQNINYKLLDTSKHYNFLEIVNIFYCSDNIISFHGCELTYGIFMKKNTQIIELTKIDHIEIWWCIMGKKFTNYGLKYKRLEVETINNNLFLNNNICFNILTQIIPLKIAFFGASITEQKVGYVYEIKKYYDNKNINIFQYGYGARYITDAGILYIDEVLKCNPNYCFLDWFSTLMIADNNYDLIEYIDTIIYKFTICKCKLIFLFFPRKDMNNDRIEMFKYVQKYLYNINISYLDISPDFKDNIDLILKDGVHTSEYGSYCFSVKINNYFKDNINNIQYPKILLNKTKYCEYNKLNFKNIIDDFIEFEGNGVIIAFKIIKNANCGIVDIYQNDIYESSYNFFDSWCCWTRESIACSININGKTKLKITNKKCDLINIESKFNNIDKKLDILDIYFIGNIKIIDYK
jgi:hypothetical protein